MIKKAKRNIYTHRIELTDLNIKNCGKDEFRKALEQVPYRGYKVEDISDGRRIVITKPGGKFVYGNVKKEDFMVFVFNPKDDTLWLISHKNILKDLEEKGAANPSETIKIIGAFERVFAGEEPDDILKQSELTNPVGESPEVLIKAYKWIWGQEDCNYPDGKGRVLSLEGITSLKERLLSNS